MNYLEIAEYCKNEFEKQCANSDRKSAYTIFYVSINEENAISLSQTPHILNNAKRCFLIHRWSQLAYTISYDTYEVQSIHADGTVKDGRLDQDYCIEIQAAHYNWPEHIYLRRNGETVYSASLWKNGEYQLHNEMERIWELYNKFLKECSTAFECKLLGKLAENERDLKEYEKLLSESSAKEQFLESEIKEFRSLLHELKTIMGEGNK